MNKELRETNAFNFEYAVYEMNKKNPPKDIHGSAIPM